MRDVAIVGCIAASMLVGCGVDVERTVVAEIDDPHHAELIDRHEHGSTIACAGGHGFGICLPKSVDEHSMHLEVEGPRARSGQVSCSAAGEDYALAWGPKAERISMRCGDENRIVYLAGDGTMLFGRAPEGVDPDSAESWDAVPYFEDAVDDLWERNHGATLVEALAYEKGQASAMALLIRKCSADEGQPWNNVLGALSDELRPAAFSALRAKLHEDPREGPILTCLLEAAAKRTEPTPADAKAARAALARPDLPLVVRRWLFFDLWRSPEAPAAACEWVGRQAPGSWREADGFLVDYAMSSILEGEQDCPALVGFVDPPCDQRFTKVDDEGQVAAYDKKDLDRLLRSTEIQNDKEVKLAERLEPSVPLVLAALLRQAPEDAAMKRRLDRLSYETTATQPRCNASMAREAACTLKPEATSGTVDDCIITLDDETRTIAAGEGPPEDAQPGP